VKNVETGDMINQMMDLEKTNISNGKNILLIVFFLKKVIKSFLLLFGNIIYLLLL
jgi:hypothetical protein